MKKRIGIIIAALIVIIMITVILIVDKNNNHKDTMQIKAFTLTKTGATIVIKNKEAYSMGEAFKVETQVNGEWKEVEFLKIKDIPAHVADFPTFTAIAIKVKENSEYEMKLDWSKMYGELKEGKYRVVKEIDKQDGKKCLYAEFKI